VSSQPNLAPEVAGQVDRALPADEFDRRVSAPLTEEELAATEALVRWFTRRYPSVRERLDYARRAWRRWTRPVRIVPRGPEDRGE
jgi:hypothetical protein